MLEVVIVVGRGDVIESINPIAGNGGKIAMDSHVPHCGTMVGSKRVFELNAPAWKKHANKIKKNANRHDIIAPPV